MIAAATIALFLEATVRAATPLGLAAVGETVSERSGVINLGIEGAIIGGAFGALVGNSVLGPVAGLLFAAAAGGVVGVCFAVFAVWLRTDQIITGTAISLLALGLTGTAYRALYGTAGAGLATETLGPVVV